MVDEQYMLTGTDIPLEGINIMGDGIKIELKYMVFSGMRYEAQGGWKDFKFWAESIEEAKELIQEIEADPLYEWAHIVKNDKIILIGKGEDGEWTWEEVEDGE